MKPQRKAAAQQRRAVERDVRKEIVRLSEEKAINGFMRSHAKGGRRKPPLAIGPERSESNRTLRVSRASANAMQQAMATKLAASAEYLLCRYDPFNARPARVPDLTSPATAVCMCTDEFSFTTVANGAYFDADFAVTPGVGGGGAAGTQSGSKANLITAYTAGLPAAQAWIPSTLGTTSGAAYGNWYMYRPVGMGVRVSPTAALTTASGTACLFQSYDPADYNGINKTGAVSYASVQEGEFVDFNRADAVEYTWSPWNIAGADGPGGTAGLDYVSSTAFITNPSIRGWVRSNVAQSFRVEVVTFYEYVPLLTARALVELGEYRGTPSTAAILETAAAAQSPQASGIAPGKPKDEGFLGFLSDVVHGVSSVAGPVLSVVESLAAL